MNIYIANLSYDVNDADLKELFEEYGSVSSAKVIMDKMSGKSRGFGFVEMDDKTQGQNAIEALDKCEYDGKTIVVNVAKERTDKPSGGYSNSRSNGGYNAGRGQSRY